MAFPAPDRQFDSISSYFDLTRSDASAPLLTGKSRGFGQFLRAQCPLCMVHADAMIAAIEEQQVKEELFADLLEYAYFVGIVDGDQRLLAYLWLLSESTAVQMH